MLKTCSHLMKMTSLDSNAGLDLVKDAQFPLHSIPTIIEDNDQTESANVNLKKSDSELDMDYKIPRWVYKHFKQNKIPSYSKYYINRKSRDISEEEAMYNAVSVCKLPLGLLQQPSNI